MILTTELSRTPTPTLAFRLARLELEGVTRKLSRLLGFHRPRHLDLSELVIPDSQIAREASALVESCEPPFLLNHSIRTYLFGAAVAKHIALKFDPEVFYLAAILHDIGLVEPYEGDGSFELNGARHARAFLQAHDMADERADRVHEAIALHSAVGIANHGSPEMRLVHFGAGVDVIGYRAEDIAKSTREAIVQKCPRHDFKRAFTEMLRDQAERKPNCHIAGHMGLGFAKKMASAPFAD